MDWLDVAILALRIALVAILYLFLLRVMFVAIGGLRATQARLWLMVVDPGASSLVAGQVFELRDGQVLGRGESAQVTVNDTAVSLEHARIARVGDAWMVADLGSTNGTRVNDVRVNGNTPLVAGDVVALGHVRLKVLSR